MCARCRNPQHPAYKYYGGRGITVCVEWADFKTFYADMRDSYKPGLTLDRNDNSGDYNPHNCQWIPQKEQTRNRRSNRLVTIGTSKHCLSKWCDDSSVPYKIVKDRVYAGWDIEAAINTPKKRFGKRVFEMNGDTHTIAEWAKIHAINPNTLKHRLQKGWSIQDAVSKEMLHSFRGNQHSA
jgi:hypothetical protein